ncbi:MAG TPA: flagellar motor protein MotB [Terriglobales bacterium]|nr:flagellar motor protein MotB [Terriglobales bacterium]
MSRRVKVHARANHERWLISYADFITLLFAFFVVLYASAQTDNKRIARVSAAIEGGFQQLAAFAGRGTGSLVLPAIQETQQKPLAPSSVAEPARGTGPGGTYSPDVNLLKRQLEQALGEEIEKHEVEMRTTPEGLVVSLREVGFFNSGEATLLPDGRNTLTRIAAILTARGFHIRVEGNTDNKPIHTRRFKSNWELSTARATEVVSLLIEKHGFDPRLVSAAGYSEYRPIATNDTEEGRRSNRRVDLVVVARTSPEGASADSSGSSAVR